MQTITKKLILHARHQGEGKFSFEFYSCDMAEYGYINLGEQTVSFDVPEREELIQREVTLLNNQKNALRVKLAEALQQINDKLMALTLIEDKSGSPVSGDDGIPF